MAQIILKAEARADKYGVVILRDESGVVVRSYKITEAELLARRVKNAGPLPGLTEEERAGGTVVILGKAFEVGDVLEEDGALWIRYAEDEHYFGRYMKLEPGEWSGTKEAPSATKAVLDTANAPELVSLEAGVLEVDMTKAR